jgi:hypothetical protein
MGKEKQWLIVINRYDEDGIKKQLQEEEREIEEAEKHQIKLEFSTNVIAAHKYCLRNVIQTGQGFDCEIIYIPGHRDPQDDRYLTKRFAVRLISKNTIIECTEIRDGWGGCCQLWLGEQHIDHDRAQKLIKHAMAIAAALINIPESEVEQERFFAELEATEEEEGDDGEVVKQQEQDHKLDLEIAELCTDVFSPVLEDAKMTVVEQSKYWLTSDIEVHYINRFNCRLRTSRQVSNEIKRI